MTEDNEFQKIEVFRRFSNEALPPLVKKYISNNVTENTSKPSSNAIETTPQSMNKNSISVDHTTADNSR